MNYRLQFWIYTVAALLWCFNTYIWGVLVGTPLGILLALLQFIGAVVYFAAAIAAAILAYQCHVDAVMLSKDLEEEH
jgi:hypothetical protein